MDRIIHVDKCGAPLCGDWSDGGPTDTFDGPATCIRCITAAGVFARCEGCGESLILCDADWDTETRPCCNTCTHYRARPDPVQVQG